MTGGGSLILDTFTVFSAYTIQTAMPNCVCTAIDSANIRMPDGTYYPTEVDLLSLGAPQDDRSWTISDGTNFTGHMISGWLRANGIKLLGSALWIRLASPSGISRLWRIRSKPRAR